MRQITPSLLVIVYAVAGLAAAAFGWLTAEGWTAGASLGLAVFAVALAGHAWLARRDAAAGLRQALSAAEEAQRALDRTVHAQGEALADLRSRLERQDDRGAQTLTSEVRVLEQLVQRMGETLNQRLLATGAPSKSPGVDKPDSRAALLVTVRDALAHNRVDLYLQPVVGLPQRRTVFYESFSRLRDEAGRVMMPAEYLGVAESEGLVATIDNLLLFRCVQIVRRLAKSDRKVGIFCNIALSSLGDEAFFPQFLEFLAENRDLSGALIFELGQDLYVRRGAVEARNMAKLADLGFRFSVDKVTDLELDLIDLQRADVKFLKVSADTLTSQLAEPDSRAASRLLRDVEPAEFAALTRRYGLEIIAEKIETERQVIDVLELNVAYGQGHLFGEPRAIRDAVLAEASPPAGFLRKTLQRRAG